MQPIIWHNPRCSKSRETLAILEEAGFEPTVVRYLETPPTVSEIRKTLKLLGMSAMELARKGEKVFKENNLKDADEETLIQAMAENPILIERAIVFYNGKAALGRPPETVKEIL